MSETLHQIFAINSAGQAISIDEAANGIACDCKCQACDAPLIARQGAIRRWSFAHQALANCTSAAETALHKAAKQVLLEARELMVPAVLAQHSVTLPDGRTGQGKVQRPQGMLKYAEPVAELPCGNIKPDVTVTTENGRVFVEIVVTNAVNRDKLEKIIALDISTLEIQLKLPRDIAPGAAWAALRTAILDDVANKKWLIEIERSWLAHEALLLAHQDAESNMITTPQPPRVQAPEQLALEAVPSAPSQPKRTQFKFGRTIVAVRIVKFWVAAHVFSSDLAVDPIVLRQIERWGGRYNAKYKNWLFKLAEEDRLRTALEKLELRLANESAYDQHQRVLEAYNAQSDQS